MMVSSEQKEGLMLPAHGESSQNGTNGDTPRGLVAVTSGDAAAKSANGNGHGAAAELPAAREEALVGAAFGDEAEIRARGWRGWWRIAQIARVLGALSLYLFLEGYEARSNFNRRMA